MATRKQKGKVVRLSWRLWCLTVLQGASIAAPFVWRRIKGIRKPSTSLVRYVSLKTQIVLVSIVEGVIAVDILAVMFRVKVLFCGINSALALGNVYIVLAMLGIPVIHTPYAAYLRKRYLQSDRFERGCWMALCLSSGAWLVLVAISV